MSTSVYRKNRKSRVRKKVSGTTERPRLSVFFSNRHFYAQVIDDEKQKTLAQCSDYSLKKGAGKNIDIKKSEEIGKKLGGILKKKKIEKVVLDRSGYRYHGRLKAFAEAIRKEGINL